MIQLFQQRDFGNKINVTFQYIVQNFKSYTLSILYIAGPLILVVFVSASLFFSQVMLGGPTRLSKPVDPTWFFRGLPYIFLMMLALLLSFLAVALVTFAHMKVYSQNDTHPVQVSQVWNEVWPNVGSALLFIILSTIVTQVAGLFFVLPGIYLAIVTSIGLPIIVFENASFGRAWSRCFQLITDKWWSTLGLSVVMGVIGYILFLSSYVPTMFIGWLIGAQLKHMGATIILSTVSGLIIMLFLLLIVGLYYVAIGFQYTNLVERQEGRGLLSAIDSIGTSPTKPRPSDEGNFLEK